MRPVWPLAGSYGHLPFPSSTAAGLRVKSSAFCKQTQIHTHKTQTMRQHRWFVVSLNYDPHDRVCKPRPSGPRTPHPPKRHVVRSHQRHAHTRTHRNPHGSIRIIQLTPVCHACLRLHLFSFCHTAVRAPGVRCVRLTPVSHCLP